MPQAPRFFAQTPMGGIRPNPRWTQPPRQHAPGQGGPYQMTQFRPRGGVQGGPINAQPGMRPMGRPMQREDTTLIQKCEAAEVGN